MIPAHYLQEGHRESPQAYVGDYLKEEVFAEGLTRNIPAFSRFFVAMGYSHGELTNYAHIARDCGIDAKTVKEYYQILVDTLLGTMLAPYKKRQDRNVIVRAGTITHRQIPQAKGEQFGRALEHFILGQGAVAIEVKGTSRIDGTDLRPLRAFVQGSRPARAYVVCNERAPRVHEGIHILPWRDFLQMLWGGAVIS